MDNAIKVLNLASGDCLRTLEGHSEPVTSVALSADGRTIISGSAEGTIKVWDLESGDCLRTLQGHSWRVSSIALSADGRTIVSGSGDTTVKVWDLASGDCLRTLEGHSEPVTSVALAADGRTVVSGSQDRSIKVWELMETRLIASFTAAQAVHTVDLVDTHLIVASDYAQIHGCGCASRRVHSRRRLIKVYSCQVCKRIELNDDD